MFTADALHCVLGDKTIFARLGFCLQPGALLLLKGANGSGKTSLLRILSGLVPAYSGRVLWQDVPIAQHPDFKQEIMWIGHKSAVKQEATVEENLAFWARLYGTETLLGAALRFYNLERYALVPARELSAGWQRRVALARLIVSPCRMWFLDEPTNFLDEEAVLLTASLIETRVTQGGIVIAASHIMQSALPSHTLIMEDFHV